MYNVSYDVDSDSEKEQYTVWTYTADFDSETGEFQMMNYRQAILNDEGTAVWTPNMDSPEVTPSELQDSATINRVSIFTGSGADDETYVDMYYNDVSFDSTELLAKDGDDSSDFTQQLDHGDSYVGIFNDVAINAIPGKYEVTTDVLPQKGN